VDIINGLQILYAHEHVYFNEKIKFGYIERLIKLYRNFRRKEKIKISEFKEVNTDNNYLVIIEGYEINAKMRLPYFKETKGVKNYKIGDKFVYMRKLATKHFRDRE
jgi:hypothetical protein